jgi:hypothetical protein
MVVTTHPAPSPSTHGRPEGRRVRRRIDVNTMQSNVHTDPLIEQDRAAAEQGLRDALVNPVLSSAQSCAVAQVHVLLAIEGRLAQLCASLDAALAAVVSSSRADDPAPAIAGRVLR